MFPGAPRAALRPWLSYLPPSGSLLSDIDHQSFDRQQDYHQFCVKVSDSKRMLYDWKCSIIEFLHSLRLTIHEPQAKVIPCGHGIPWLGFVVYPTHRRVKSRNVVKFSRRLRDRWSEYCAGRITFAEFDASVKGWVNHVRYADTWGLRSSVLGKRLIFRAPYAALWSIRAFCRASR